MAASSCSLKETRLFLFFAHAIHLPRMLFFVSILPPVLSVNIISSEKPLNSASKITPRATRSATGIFLHAFPHLQSSCLCIFYSLISVFLQHCELRRTRCPAPLFAAEGADVLPSTSILHTHCPPSVLPELASGACCLGGTDVGCLGPFLRRSLLPSRGRVSAGWFLSALFRSSCLMPFLGWPESGDCMRQAYKGPTTSVHQGASQMGNS